MPDLNIAIQHDKLLKSELLARWPELEQDAKALFDTLDSISDFDEQVFAALREARERKAFADGLSTLIQQMQERKARFEAGAERIRAAVLFAMQETGRPKLIAPDMTVSAQAGRPGAVVIEAERLPAGFVRIERKPLMAEIAKALKAGETVPGAELRNGSPSLTVRAT